MHRLLSVLLCMVVLAILPTVAFAHGSNILEPGHETGTHGHADHTASADADEFDELHEQIEQLEKQLITHDERVRMTDIVGGIGYIVGIAGVTYYYLGLRRNKPVPSPAGRG